MINFGTSAYLKLLTPQMLEHLARMSDVEAETNAATDPDNRPLTSDDFAKARQMPRVKVIRRALGLTQEAFAERFAIPLGTLRDWEQERSSPDGPARAYLKVIAVNPEAAAEALRKGAA